MNPLAKCSDTIAPVMLSLSNIPETTKSKMLGLSRGDLAHILAPSENAGCRRQGRVRAATS
jgi:hypothetical protein